MVREVLIVRPSACEPRGRAAGDARHVAQRIGAYLVATERLPDGIVARPDRRSRRLAEEAAKVMGLSAAAVAHAPDRRHGGRAPLVAALQVLQGERLLAFGELPGLELPPAPLLAVEQLSDKPRIRDVISHRHLPETFPFPMISGIEQRPCPAYYYFQTGVIPYRESAAGPEILLITNHKKTKWAIPKGIHEPGYSPQASAAKEAFEEAGVLGEVGDDVLGSYAIEKWGGTCAVTVFGMRVTCVLETWEEPHRGRRWVPAARAAGKIKKKSLARIVARFAKTLST